MELCFHWTFLLLLLPREHHRLGDLHLSEGGPGALGLGGPGPGGLGPGGLHRSLGLPLLRRTGRHHPQVRGRLLLRHRDIRRSDGVSGEGRSLWRASDQWTLALALWVGLGPLQETQTLWSPDGPQRVWVLWGPSGLQDQDLVVKGRRNSRMIIMTIFSQMSQKYFLKSNSQINIKMEALYCI